MRAPKKAFDKSHYTEIEIRLEIGMLDAHPPPDHYTNQMCPKLSQKEDRSGVKELKI